MLSHSSSILPTTFQLYGLRRYIPHRLEMARRSSRRKRRTICMRPRLDVL